jgi:hypothetical protein
MAKNYQVDEVIRSLSKKGCFITQREAKTTRLNYIEFKKDGGVKVKKENVEVGSFSCCLHNASNLGNGSWGKIGFLQLKGFTVLGQGVYSELTKRKLN